jgi:hypothetical protein
MGRNGLRAFNKKASNAEIAENDSRVFDKGNGLFRFSRRALRPLRFNVLQADAKGIIAALADGSTACYTDRKPKFRILCVSG